MCNIKQLIRALLRWIEVIDYIFTCMYILCLYAIQTSGLLCVLCEAIV